MKKIIISIFFCIFPILGIYSETLIIGGKAYTESKLYATITHDYLKKQGFNVDLRMGLITDTLRKKFNHNKVHIFWEYTGTRFRYDLFKGTEEDIKLSSNGDKLYSFIKEYDAKNGITWLNKSSTHRCSGFCP